MGKVDEIFVSLAKSLGLDEKLFIEKYESEETDKAVATDFALANRLKLSGTPTFFVNGEQVAANFVLDKVKQALGNGN
ncbi:DsbA family protein [Candidatus Collierbacteria bacterium]|nr:DsbA family protein [Candidatus Collierbacteria bacterium]